MSEDEITVSLTYLEVTALVSAANEQARTLDRLAGKAIRADMATLGETITERAKLLDGLAAKLVKLLPCDAVAVAGGDL